MRCFTFKEPLWLTLMCSTVGDEAVWHSNTAPKRDVILVIQNDGNLVLYEGNPVWATSTTPTA